MDVSDPLDGILTHMFEQLRNKHKIHSHTVFSHKEGLDAAERNFKRAESVWHDAQVSYHRNIAVLDASHVKGVNYLQNKLSLYRLIKIHNAGICKEAYELAKNGNHTSPSNPEKEGVYMLSISLLREEFGPFPSPDMEEWYNFLCQQKKNKIVCCV